MTNKYTKCSQDISHSSGPREREPEPPRRFTAFHRQSLPPLSHAIARSQSEKALLPKQVALPGRGWVTGEVTPKHSQFIACRQGAGAGLGPRGLQRARRMQQETRMALSCSLHPAVPSLRGLHSPRGTLAFNGRRRAPACRGWKGSQGTPTPLAPQICSPGLGCGARAGGKLSPQRDSPQPWGQSTKLTAQSRGRERPPRCTWGYLVSLHGRGVRDQGKRGSGRGFI